MDTNPKPTNKRETLNIRTKPEEATGVLPSQYSEPGALVAIDGSLIDSVLSMHWAAPFVAPQTPVTQDSILIC
jgi:hypothetical protein